MRVFTWLGSLDDAARDAGLPPLDAAEQERARAFTSGTARARFGALRRVQRQLLGDILDVHPGRLVSAYECPDCGRGAGHGRPGYALTGVGPENSSPQISVPQNPRPQSLPGVALSASRAGEWGAVVVVTGADPDFRIGLDLTLEREIFDGFDDVAVSGPERDWLRTQEPGARNAGRAALWAAKEAVAKRDGHGLRTDPSGIPVLAARGHRRTPAGDATAYAPGVVWLEARAEGLPPHVLTAAVPAAAEGAFRAAMAGVDRPRRAPAPVNPRG
ncbi:phosphopantetheinyl transferase [Arthrobacter woluwensis]|uniref:4'-phosphopantetheinyl transferase family protein n=1 Tax=Arthrobacter woluwensis TaxID=156980 RepID=UPI002782013E|nr:4'-phosphopantetheinyl transferase superfamily protein [Arthrobacter woluwensis]MDQ0708305.1 phosphopantetheinyl transferase [Arthrobacter woluwensis]